VAAAGWLRPWPARMDDMRYIIIGAGAVGGTIGGRLFEGGHEVVLVARGSHLDALRAQGLRLVTPDGEVALPVAAVGQPGELDLRDGDVLVLAVKTQDAEAVLAEWAWRARPRRHGGGRVAARGVRAERGGERADRPAPLPARVRDVRLAARHAPGAWHG
jgi:choline dehydrogenase-like flavoprotein